MVSSKKKVLSAFLSLAMIGSMVAAVPLTASAAETTTTATPGVTYEVQGQTYGWSQGYKSDGAEAGTEGLAKRLEAIKINLTNAPAGASISYQVHGQSYGWSQAAVVTNAGTDNAAVKYAGTVGQAKRLEAIRITLNGMPGYAVEYKVHQQSYGTDKNWTVVPNGTAIAAAAIDGVTGQSKRLEAIEIKIVPTVASVSAVNSTIAVGGTTTFTFKDAAGNAYTPKTVSYSLADSSFGSIDSATGKFTAAQAGAAVINVVADGVKLSTTVQVSGAVAGVKITTPSTVIANKASVQNVTVQAVDAKGYPVSSFNGSATFGISGSGSDYYASTVTSPAYGTGMLGASTNLAFTNGVATVQVIGGAVAGISDTLTVSALKDAAGNSIVNYTPTTATVSTTAQVATSISVSAPATVQANAATTAPVSFEVKDQAAQTMLSGVYGLTVHISGVATYSDGTTADKTISFVGGTTDPTVTLTSVKGVVGATTITASATGIASGSATTQSVVAGNASKLKVVNSNSSATTNDFVTASAGQTYTVDTLDANGVNLSTTASSAAHPFTVYVTNADGTAATNIKVNGTAESTSGVALTTGVSIFTITDTAASADVGTYTVVVKDGASSGAYTASDAFTFKVTAQSASLVSLSTVNNYVAASNPTTTVKAQITDANGNAVATSGVAVTFTASAAASSKAAFNGGTAVAAPSITVYTDATGLATATFTAQTYATTWTVVASAAISGVTPAPTDTKTIAVVYQPVASLSVSAKATVSGSTTQVVAGAQLSVKVSQLDSYGNTIDNTVPGNENDNIKVTLSNANAIAWPLVGATGASIDSTAGTISGTVTQVNAYLALAGLNAHQAGAVTFTAQDTSVTAGSGTAGIAVIPGAFNGFALFNSNGVLSTSNEVTVAANTPVALSLVPVDIASNPVAAPAGYTVPLTAGSGNFTTTSGGASVPSVTFNSGVYSMPVYYVNTTAGSYLPTVGTAVIVPGTYTQIATSFTTAPTTTAVSAADASTAINVTVKDQYGAVMSGVTVTFALQTSPAAVGSLSALTAVTSGSGVATVNYVGPHTNGATATDVVTVTVGSLATQTSTFNVAAI